MISDEEETAVLLIGGEEYNSNHGSNRSQKVELWGCPNVQGNSQSMAVSDFPMITIDSSGIYRKQQRDVLVCGGIGNCPRGKHQHKCEVPNSCFTWDPKTDIWEYQQARLNDPSGNQLLFMHENKVKVLYGMDGKLQTSESM
jgi:hypothetical protein